MRTSFSCSLIAVVSCFGSVVDAKDSADAPPARVLVGHEEWITGLAFTPDGSQMVTGSRDKTVRVWDVKTKETVREINIALPVYGLALSPDGKTVAVMTPHPDETGDFPRKYQYGLWDLKSGDRIKVLDVGEVEGGPSFSPDGKTIVTAEEKVIKVWDVESGTAREVFHDEYWCNHPVFSPDGSRLACATGKQGPLLVKLSGADVPNLEPSKIFPYQFAFSPDGKTLAACGHTKDIADPQGGIAMWDATTGKLRRTLICDPPEGRLANGVIFGLGFSPDGRLLASGHPHFSVRLWDPANGKVLKTWKNYTRLGELTGGVGPLAFSPNGKTLAVANGEYVNLWSMRALLKP